MLTRALLCTATLATTVPAHGGDHHVRLATLEAQVARLEAARSGADLSAGLSAGLSAERAEAVRALAQGVLAEADTRASLLQADATAGYDRGFFVGSSDGGFRLKLNGQVQVRFVANHQDDGSTDADRWGFDNRRTKLTFSGHVAHDWTFAVKLAMSGASRVQDAWIARAIGDGWTVKIGQFKVPALREELMSASRQLAVDRSIVNARFSQKRAHGIGLTRRGEQMSFAAMVHDGSRSSNTAWFAETTEIALSARTEFLVAGSWSQFKDFSAARGGETGLLIGGAVSYERDESGTTAGPEETTLLLTVDASLELDAVNVFAAFVYQDLDEADRNPWGLVIQGGVRVTDAWEVFARYEYGDADTAAEDLGAATVGVTHFIDGHRIKWTTDVGYASDEVDDEWDSTSVGWRADAAGDDGQLVLRTQLQVTF